MMYCALCCVMLRCVMADGRNLSINMPLETGNTLVLTVFVVFHSELFLLFVVRTRRHYWCLVRTGPKGCSGLTPVWRVSCGRCRP